MPSAKKQQSGSSNNRDYDKESGKDKTKKSSKKQAAPPPPTYEVDTPSENESDSEVEEYEKEKETPIKDKPKQSYQKNDKKKGDDYVPASTRTKRPQRRPVSPEIQNVESVEPDMESLTPFLNSKISKPDHKSDSFFTVSFEQLYNRHYMLEDIIDENPRIYQVLPEFNVMCSRIYIGMIGVYHILRCRDEAGITLNPEERRVFRRFEKEMPAATCTIPGPLVNWFRAIGFIDIGDEVYGKAIPALPTLPANMQTWSCNISASGNGVFPPLPWMIAFIKEIARIGDVAACTTKGDTLIPASIPADGADAMFMNISFGTHLTPGDNDAVAGQTQQDLFAKPGLSYPMRSVQDYFTDADLRSIKRYNLPTFTYHATAANATPIDNIERYLGFTNTASPSLNWLLKCRQHTDALSKFFTGQTTLDKIETECDERVLCLTRFPSSAAAPAAHTNLHIETKYTGFFRRTGEVVSRYPLEDGLIARAAAMQIIPVILNDEGQRTTDAAGNLTPYGNNLSTSHLSGPIYRFFNHTTNEYTGNFRNRWRKELTLQRDYTPQVADAFRRTMYKPNGTSNDASVFVLNK
ncbi:coat protein [Tulasnella partitivirus 2]|nr:coat protein [Tulasnella partitivirus 2]